MNATVHNLGTGTCGPKHGAQRRAHPGFLVRWGVGDKHLLWECSAGIAERLEDIREKPHEIRHLAISHAHCDHCFLQGFLQTCLCHQASEPGFSWSNSAAFPTLNLYAPGHILNDIPRGNAFHFEGEGEKGLPFPVVRPFNTTPDESQIYGKRQRYMLDGEAELTSVKVYHDSGKSDAVAYRLSVGDKRIVYSGDCGHDPGFNTAQRLILLAEDADFFICEASERIGKNSAHAYGHLNPRQAGEIARDAKAKRLMLTHYSGADSNEAMQADCRSSGYEGEITIAKDGETYEV